MSTHNESRRFRGQPFGKNGILFVAMMFLSALSGGFVLPLFALFVEVLGGSFVLIGLVIFGRESTGTLGRIPLGSLSDHWGRKPLLLVGTGGYAFSPWIYSLVKEAIYLLPFTVIHGLTTACLWPTAYVTVSDLSNVGKRGQAIGIFSVITGTGYAFGIVLGGILSKTHQFVFTYRMASVFGLIAFLGCLLGFQETHPTERLSDGLENREERFLDQFKLLRQPILLIAAVSGLAGSLTLAMGTTFFPLYGAQVGRTEAEIGVILMMTPLIGNMLNLPIGKLADMIDKRALLFSTILFGLLLVALIPLVESFLVFLLIFALLSVPDTAIQIVPLAFVADSIEIPRKGLGLGMIQTSNHMGKAISPLLFSLLAGTASLAYSFWVSSLISGILLIILIITAKRAKST